MRRKHEVINGHHISVWDSGKKVIDRYTVVYLDNVYDNGHVDYLAMNVDSAAHSPPSLAGWG